MATCPVPSSDSAKARPRTTGMPSTEKYSGLTVITYLNEVAYRSGDLGLGSAVGWIVALMIMTFSFLQYRVSKVAENE